MDGAALFIFEFLQRMIMPLAEESSEYIDDVKMVLDSGSLCSRMHGPYSSPHIDAAKIKLPSQNVAERRATCDI